MKEYDVVVTEIVTYRVTVEADSEYEAKEAGIDIITQNGEDHFVEVTERRAVAFET